MVFVGMTLLKTCELRRETKKDPGRTGVRVDDLKQVSKMTYGQPPQFGAKPPDIP
jgi:hypothetical protein